MCHYTLFLAILNMFCNIIAQVSASNVVTKFHTETIMHVSEIIIYAEV